MRVLCQGRSCGFGKFGARACDMHMHMHMHVHMCMRMCMCMCMWITARRKQLKNVKVHEQ